MSNIEMLNIQKRWGDLILKCLPEKTQMSISLGGGPDSAGRCYKTTVTKTYTNKMICKTCTGNRAGHNILDNYKGAGVRILLSDQFAPSTLCDSGEMCTGVLRYSNSMLADMQLEVMTSTKPQRFWVNPKMHVESEEEVRVHKEQCWTTQEEELERNLLRCQNV